MMLKQQAPALDTRGPAFRMLLDERLRANELEQTSNNGGVVDAPMPGK